VLENLPSEALFDSVVGQRDIIEQLRAAATKPVHAYLLVGPAGLQQRDIVRGFAAALLCPDGGCGICDTCRRVRTGVHPDLVEVERAGANLAVDDARRVVRMAYRRPREADRQVISIADMHLARLAAPVLLKTLEEPPSSTVLVLLADSITPELVTVASRCVRLELSPVSADELADWLEASGVSAEDARRAANAAGGSPDKARLLSDDPSVEARRQLWRSGPARLDGTGSTVVRLAEELVEASASSVEPLRQRHQAELEMLAERAKAAGERGVAGRREIEDRHKREERRLRTDELKAGLSELAGAYRDRAVERAREGSAHAQAKVMDLARACDLVGEAAIELIRNPNETLLLESLFIRLSALSEV
jgi:DNA polymerase III subunit delta'